MNFLRLLHASERRSSNFARRERVMLEGGLNRLIRRGFAARRGVVMVLWHTTGSPNSGEHRLIALSEVDTAFDEKAVKELGRAAKVPTGADIARFGENIRIAARLYLEGKSRLNAPRLREKIERLYQLNTRAERGSDRAARALARGVEIMDDDVRRWLDSCNAGRCREIPTPAEILSPQTRQSAIKRFRLILSFGGDVGPGRKRAGGRRSRSFTPHLRVPQGRRRGRPPGPEGDFVWWLAAAYLEATGKAPPYTANTDAMGPFARFVFECFEKVGAPTGSVIRLINQFGSVCRKMERAHTDRAVSHF